MYSNPSTLYGNATPQDHLLEDIALMESQGKPLVFTARLPEGKANDKEFYQKVEQSLKKYSMQLSPFFEFGGDFGIFSDDYDLARKMVRDYRKNLLDDLEILEVDRLDMRLQAVA